MGLEIVSALALRLCYWRGSLGKQNDLFQIVQPDGCGFFKYLWGKCSKLTCAVRNKHAELWSRRKQDPLLLCFLRSASQGSLMPRTSSAAVPNLLREVSWLEPGRISSSWSAKPHRDSVSAPQQSHLPYPRGCPSWKITLDSLCREPNDSFIADLC